MSDMPCDQEDTGDVDYGVNYFVGGPLVFGDRIATAEPGSLRIHWDDPQRDTFPAACMRGNWGWRPLV